ncbi:MAG: toll/interleukin-1 receptor domain-containing protein, partial [Terriglobia bacterium]
MKHKTRKEKTENGKQGKPFGKLPSAPLPSTALRASRVNGASRTSTGIPRARHAGRRALHRARLEERAASPNAMEGAEIALWASMKLPMPLDEIASRYAQQLFVQNLEKAARENDERIVAIKRDFAKRGMIQSGGYIAAIAQAGLSRLEYVARARVDSLLAAYEKSGIPLSDQVVEEILAQMVPLCETQKKSLIKTMGETIQQTFPGSAPSGLHTALSGEIERKVSRIVADISRELRIKRDEAILEARRRASLGNQKHAEEWDFFICHASEDKEDFVYSLAEALHAKGLRVWYDDFVLNVGDSLREAIDRGLARSRFGVVVLSPSFFARDWPKKELDGLVA